MRTLPDTWFYGSIDAEHRFCQLDSTESGHLLRTFRAREGSHAEVCNGKGLVVLAEVETPDQEHCRLRVLEILQHDPTPPALCLAAALLKGDGLEEAAEDCLQAPLGELLVLHSERCLVPAGATHQRLMRRLESKSIVAMKQAKKPWITQIRGPLLLSEWLNEKARRILLDQNGQPRVTSMPERDSVWLCVGPEGGFSPREVEAFQANGAELLSLGKTRYRAKTAGIAAIGYLQGLAAGNPA